MRAALISKKTRPREGDLGWTSSRVVDCECELGELEVEDELGRLLEEGNSLFEELQLG